MPTFGPIVNNILIGGRQAIDVSADDDNYFILGMTGAETAGTGNNYTFRKVNGTAGYQVPASTIFQVEWFDAVNIDAANGKIALIYSDNDVGSAGGALTNPIVMYGVAGMPHLVIAGVIGATAERVVGEWEVPATKFINFALTRVGGAGTVNTPCLIGGREKAA